MHISHTPCLVSLTSLGNKNGIFFGHSLCFNVNENTSGKDLVWVRVFLKLVFEKNPQSPCWNGLNDSVVAQGSCLLSSLSFFSLAKTDQVLCHRWRVAYPQHNAATTMVQISNAVEGAVFSFFMPHKLKCSLTKTFSFHLIWPGKD